MCTDNHVLPPVGFSRSILNMSRREACLQEIGDELEVNRHRFEWWPVADQILEKPGQFPWSKDVRPRLCQQLVKRPPTGIADVLIPSLLLGHRSLRRERVRPHEEVVVHDAVVACGVSGSDDYSVPPMRRSADNLQPDRRDPARSLSPSDGVVDQALGDSSRRSAGMSESLNGLRPFRAMSSRNHTGLYR